MGFWLPVLSEGKVFVHNDCPGGGGFLPSSNRVLGVCPKGGMVMDEIDTCISLRQSTGYPSVTSKSNSLPYSEHSSN